MKRLAPRQKEIWDLRRPLAEGGAGKTEKEAAAILGISHHVVNKTMTVIYRKLGITDAKDRDHVQPLEVTDPERAAAALDALTEPASTMEDALRANGFPAQASQNFLRRIRRKYPGAIHDIRALKTVELSELLGKKIHMALAAIDEKVVLEASYRDLAMGATMMIEKRQLLLGEPTQIISDHERKKLHELLPLMIAEAQRRGLTVDGTAERVG